MLLGWFEGWMLNASEWSEACVVDLAGVLLARVQQRVGVVPMSLLLHSSHLLVCAPGSQLLLITYVSRLS